MNDYPALLSHPILHTLWIVLLVVLVEKLWVWPDKYHPLSFFRLLASRMADKVHPGLNHTPYQQRLSGSLAPLVLLTPILVCIGLFIGLAEYPQFFDALLLYIAIRFQPVPKAMRHVQSALAVNKKALARDKSRALLLRETELLTSMGLSKAVVESAVKRFLYQFCTPLFWFLLLGGVGALAYRLLYEFSQVWNIKQRRFVHFGAPISWLCRVFQWLPVRLGLLTLMAAENLTGAIRARKRLAKGVGQQTRLLAYAGGALGIELGGPAIYDGVKRRWPKCGGLREARVEDIARARHSLLRAQAIMLTLLLLGYAFYFAMGHIR
ncbi:cobalamin biosynthesis protein [Aliiglaciecola sp. CAU 1673]|uniref:cobalamin biosynthesis protein CobD/CbiB n=1 Tax=Aliiglaciecola sp. CAU 1673 TaxID=3032595 RepID=UPI0023DB63E7|nr:cobalamin biosynthesis protein [Aliiglaciecola sp. CAU 1673]MDF2178506.1 cobalamin biosynthesis protein [Aliiglaciecola sp. CAU 1673]